MTQITEILIVEDDETDFMIAQEVIRNIPNINYQIDWAKDTKTAIQKIKERPYDAYLIDYRLGSGDGLEIIRQSKNIGIDGPFLLLTSTDDPDLHTKSAEAGAHDYILKKELSSSLLNRTITHAIKRKAAEDAFKNERIFTSNLLSEIPYMIMSVSKDGQIMSTNPAVTKTTGYQEKDLIGKHWKFLATTKKGGFNYNVNKDGDVGFTSELSNKNGKTLIVEWNILDKNINPKRGDELGFILLGKNITEDVELAQQAHQKEKMEALGHLAGGVAHEINNLLQPILFTADMMKSEFEDGSTQHASLERMLRNAKAAGDIVNDVLIFSRKDQTNNSDMPLDQTILNTIHLVQDMLPEDTKLEIKGLSKNSKDISHINQTDMIRIMSNLLINAAHAMNDKGTIEISKKVVTIQSGDKPLELEPGAYAKINIKDTGKGISKDVLENIFTPFFTTKEVGQGTGLGLSIVHNTLSNWEGTVTVKSKEGEGTTFSLYIPIIH